jgi:hypothetical protein
MANKKLVQQNRVRTNTTKDSVCSIKVDPVTFSKLWESYPGGHPYSDSKTGKPPKGYENQCAIKVSKAIHGAGIQMKSFNGASVTMDDLKTAVVATQLADWLKLQPFCGLPKEPENITGKEWESKIKSRSGIIYFENYWHRQGETKVATGDHIDLWNGSKLTPNAVNNVRRLGLNSVQWLPWPLDDLNFSDLGNSTKILFWEVK